MQRLKNRGRFNSLPWRKVLVCDFEHEAFEVMSEKDIR